jgi:prepilin-type N-terminal cleavage/methylation domain-containing protein
LVLLHHTNDVLTRQESLAAGDVQMALFRASLSSGPIRLSVAATAFPRRGMTLVELLVVVAIIGMLMGLALPAINAAREAGRRTQCVNHLRQLALAALSYESAHGSLPGGGWGERWGPVPGRVGRRQPAAWSYGLLPYLERKDLAELGSDVPLAQREAQITKLLPIPLAVFHCPSRRSARAYPLTNPSSRQLIGAEIVPQAARSDYAINAGDQRQCEAPSGWRFPFSLADGDAADFAWPSEALYSGVSYVHSQITLGHATDGAARTYLFGEKALPPWDYDTGADLGDDFPVYGGCSNDTHRSAHAKPARDGGATGFDCAFGSAHPFIWNVCFVDGSARSLSFDIDLAVHRSLANRRDRLVVGDDSIE